MKRGHQVTAIVRDASKMNKRGVQILEKSVFDLTTEDINICNDP